jgi:flagellar biogenesis protein FliO
VTRTAFLALAVWVLLLCAPIHDARADSPSGSPPGSTSGSSPGSTHNTSARSTLQTPPQDGAPAGDSRLTRLARRLSADESGQTKPGTPLVASDTPHNTARPGGTPLITGTPLLRRGLADKADAPKRPGDTYWMLKTLTALGVVIGLALLARLGYARLGGKVAAASPVVEVLSRTHVAPRSHVMLLRVGGRVLIVSESSAGMRTLANVDDAQEVADLLGAVSAARPTSISRGFNQLFKRFDEDYDQPSAVQDGGGVQGGRLGRTRDSVSGLLARMRGLGRGEGAP